MSWWTNLTAFLTVQGTGRTDSDITYQQDRVGGYLPQELVNKNHRLAEVYRGDAIVKHLSLGSRTVLAKHKPVLCEVPDMQHQRPREACLSLYLLCCKPAC